MLKNVEMLFQKLPNKILQSVDYPDWQLTKLVHHMSVIASFNLSTFT